MAWKPLGWEPIAFSEISPFASAVLSARFPSVPNLGDMQNYDAWKIKEEVNLLVGGTPCQSFSVAGLRQGFKDPRGNLTLSYLGLVDRFRPRWIVWENVPGILHSNGGRDFGSFLGGLANLGYGFSYRVLDAQYVRTQSYPVAVPQRRRRVFVVGHTGGDWKRTAKVLFEPEGVRGNPPTRRKTREEVTGRIEAGVRRSDKESGPWPLEVADPITANESGTYTHEGKKNFRLHNVFSSEPIPFDTTQLTNANNRADLKPGKPCHTLAHHSHVPAIANASSLQVRKLTPKECERLQGFPDDWTLVKYKGKLVEPYQRYRAIGNSMAVNVMRWLGERIAEHV